MVRVDRSTILLVAVVAILVALFSGKLPVFASIVFGTSMLPTLRPLDMVIAVKPWIKSVRVGEIAIVEVDGVRLVHRVIEVKDGYVVTKGDNNRFADPPTRIVLGVVVVIVPREAIFLSIALATLTAYRPRKWLAIASAPLVGIVLASIAVMIMTSSILQSIESIVSLPHLEMRFFRTSIAVTRVGLYIGNATITSARCWVDNVAAKTRVSKVGNEWVVTIEIPIENASRLAQLRSYVAFSCVATIELRGKEYTYRMYKTESVPKVADFVVKATSRGIAIRASATPFGLPIEANITISGCSKTLRVSKELYTSKYVYVPWRCSELTLVRVETVVGGKHVLKTYVVQLERG